MSDTAMATEQTLHDLYRDHSGWLEGWRGA